VEQIINKDAETRLLNLTEVCKRLSIGHCGVYNLINKRALKTVKIGRRRLVSMQALKEFIESHGE